MLFEVYDTDSPAGEVWLLNIQTDAGLAENESMARIKELSFSIYNILTCLSLTQTIQT